MLAVNKMDLVGFDEPTFRTIAGEFTAYAAGLGISDVVAVPLSALAGDNVVDRSTRTPWYDGPTLLEHLEGVEVGRDAQSEAFRFPVQVVIRPRTPEFPDYRGYAGRVASGVVRVGNRAPVCCGGASRHASSSASDDDGGGFHARCANGPKKRGLGWARARR